MYNERCVFFVGRELVCRAIIMYNNDVEKLCIMKGVCCSYVEKVFFLCREIVCGEIIMYTNDILMM